MAIERINSEGGLRPVGLTQIVADCGDTTEKEERGSAHGRGKTDLVAASDLPEFIHLQ